MSATPAYSVVIPACNEAASVGPLVTTLLGLGGDAEVIVVDDGSSDATAAEAMAAGARVVRHAGNLGNGAALKSGARAASGAVVIFLDADGQHDPRDVPALLAHTGTHDMVVAARALRAHGSLVRALGNAFLGLLASAFTGRRIPDLTSGFRAIRRPALLRFVGLLPNGFSSPTTLTLAVLQSGGSVRYVPLSGISRRRGGTSKLRPVRDGLRAALTIVRITVRFSPLRVFLPLALVLAVAGFAASSVGLLAGAAAVVGIAASAERAARPRRGVDDAA